MALSVCLRDVRTPVLAGVLVVTLFCYVLRAYLIPNMSLCFTPDTLTAVIMIIVIILFVCYKHTSKKVKDLNSTNAQLEKDLKKNKGRFTALMEQKAELETQRDEYILQLEDVEREKEKNKEQLQLLEEKMTKSETEKTVGKLHGLLIEKERLLESKWKLDQMKTEQEKVILQIDKLLQTIDTVNIPMTTRKNSLNV